MRGVDLSVFDFDFDLTWAAFFMNDRGYVYGRYGSRDEGSAESGLSLSGLKYAMQQSLNAHQKNPKVEPVLIKKKSKSFATKPEGYPAAKRLKKDACIHCHQVNNFRIEVLFKENQWRKDCMWVYPPAKNVGLEMEIDQGDKIQSVAPNGPAQQAGLRAGDVLSTVNSVPIASGADLQYALEKVSQQENVPLVWLRQGRQHRGQLTLKKGWRRSDVSWRASMWAMPPVTGVYGRDLTEKQKKELNIPAENLAFYMGKFVPRQPRQAGIRANDVILGVDDKPLKMTMLQFNVYIRENFDVGDRVVFNVLRGGKRINLPMKLTLRTTW